ncbi:MAG: DNA-directed RNA polymerase subunit alpha [Sedimentisphaerales bacterium]|nr:DNA-directed RNA polymerase subunit alpha [Sedimentisphaerales bacterium]
MRIRWRGLELPTRVDIDQNVSNLTYGRLRIEPFERGFGITIGNSLRRILLSSLEGSAVTSVKIHNVQHEFTSLPGVMEDITDVILNVKSLVVRMEGDEPRVMKLQANSKGPVTAAAIQADSAITILNKNQVIATLTGEVNFSMEMIVKKGRGYVPGTYEDKTGENQELGVIPIDAVFSPVKRVRYKTEETRVGQRIDYDRLVIEIWTDGTITPEMALVESAKILRKHMGPLIKYSDLGEREIRPVKDTPDVVETAFDDELRKKLQLPISILELTVRANNCLEMAKIETIGQLVSMKESRLLALRSFGKTSLREVKRKLADMGLMLGMNVEQSGE